MNARGLLLLDLDNTLWDFDGNAEEALAELFHRHHLHLKSSSTVHEFIRRYQVINKSYWKKYEAGEIGKDLLRTARFTDTFREMGIPDEEHPENVWEEYLEICPVMTRMMPGAMAFLQEVHRKFDIVLVTNGFEKTQRLKISHSGIEPWIRFMVTSESAGIAKPDPRIFHHAIQQYEEANGSPRHVFYAGDTWDTDVRGGIEAGITTAWFNHGNLPMPEDEYSSHALFAGTCTSLLELGSMLCERV